jgi:DNA primase
MLTAESPLDRAIKAITISEAWRRLNLSGEPNKSCCVPWRDDMHPSLSIYDNDRMFKDHGTGENGNVVKFVSLAAVVDMSVAARMLIE